MTVGPETTKSGASSSGGSQALGQRMQVFTSGRGGTWHDTMTFREETRAKHKATKVVIGQQGGTRAFTARRLQQPVARPTTREVAEE